jgi:hypothetical protein
MTQVKLGRPAPSESPMLGRATSTTVASMNASPEPRTVAATTQRARGDPNAIAGSVAGGKADVSWCERHDVWTA